MIYGTGMLAKAMHAIDKETELYFASGVSNSLETSAFEFKREQLLLEKAILDCRNHDLRLHYFSTTGVAALTSDVRPYFHHKNNMESIIQDQLPNIQTKIYRLPNIVGPTTNVHTLTNFIYNQLRIRQDHSLNLQLRRELIDVDDVVSFIRNNNDTAHIHRLFGITCLVGEIVAAMRNTPGSNQEIYTLLSKYYDLSLLKV